MAVRRASTEALSQRFLHLRISPRPANLSESREIHRVLQRFGEISKYYNLQFEYHSPAPNSALLIYRDTAAAQAALAASPIRFALERTQHDPKTADETDDYNLSLFDESAADGDGDANAPPLPQMTPGIDEILAPSPLLTRTTPAPEPTSTTAEPPLPFAPPRKPPKTVSRWFQVTVDRSRAIHQDYVERQPFWKQFEPMRSLAQLDLARKVPHAGLSDVSKRPPHAYRTPNHVLAAMNRHLQFGQESLVKMWEEGEGGK
ncbi:hypothetical protein DPSP01_005050 [Paraphaeosphaeria sporulosa]|uniref:Uncharacterized protein n=1 Tax=Paraphaeosphaeria sporulosa TaxID=1460663 RepID=A0A177C079_9PLEO|nr:uncharacterized protein CC84DRAFT_268952 [Paraphaeosphaeria sporulosa]OAG00875.1 hypothetical protein CC84DRAFT_268952 [Paraphaeosphaeria sporulosa]